MARPGPSVSRDPDGATPSPGDDVRHSATGERDGNQQLITLDKFLGSLRDGAPVTLKFHFYSGFYSGAALTHHVTKSSTSVTGSTSNTHHFPVPDPGGRDPYVSEGFA